MESVCSILYDIYTLKLVHSLNAKRGGRVHVRRGGIKRKDGDKECSDSIFDCIFSLYIYIYG